MKIEDIPKELLSNPFVSSIYRQLNKNKKLSEKQLNLINKIITEHKEKESVIPDEILDYIIPKSLQSNNFIKSLYLQYKKTGKLSERQIEGLRNILDIDNDFLVSGLEFPEALKDSEVLKQDFEKLKRKYLNNKFKKAKNKNRCEKAIRSIINQQPDYGLIDEILNPDYKHWRY